MKTLAGLLLLGACLIPMAAPAQNMNADDLKWINQCIADNKERARRNTADCSGLLCVHEREDGRQRKAVHHAVGKIAPRGTEGLRQAVRLALSA